MSTPAVHTPDDEVANDFYRTVLQTLGQAGVPFLVGGTYALHRHADIVRSTKDLDLFVHRRDWRRIEEVLGAESIRVEMPFSHWLGKARRDDLLVDLIFAGGNGLATVDDEWFQHGIPSSISDLPVLLCPAEETIWSKSFVMERERFDGADVLHILRKSGPTLDWDRLERRFGERAPVLLAHLLLFRFVYPGERHVVPADVLARLWARALEEHEDARLCRGTLISREQYLIDVNEWGYVDARLIPHGNMTPDQVAVWTAQISEDHG